MTSLHTEITPNPPSATRSPGRRVGYVAAAIVNAIVLWLVHQLPGWDWPRFLTDDFTELLPILTVSFVVSIAFNVAWVLADPDWFKALGDLVIASVGLWVGIRTLQVYPFDFSTYAVNWSWLARTVVIVGIVGTSLGALTALGRLVGAMFSVDR